MSDFPNGYFNPTYTGDVKGNSVNVDLFSISKFHEALKKYLKSQGLEYKDGEIVTKLVDSQDEKIREAIIALIEFGLENKSAIAPGYNITKEEALAWLEKQSEQILANSAKTCKNEHGE